MSTGSRRGQKYHARRQDIVDIAARLFAENGYAATGIAEIGEAVDLARGALYYYIGSKETLLAEIHDRVLDPLLEQSEAIVALDAVPAVKLRLISEVLLRLIIERQDHVWVFLHEYRSLTGAARQTFRDKRARFESCLSDLFTEGARRGMFIRSEVETTTLAFLGMHNYTYQWIRTRKIGVEQLADAYCSIFFGGILAGPGEPYSRQDLESARRALDTATAGQDASTRPAARPKRRSARTERDLARP